MNAPAIQGFRMVVPIVLTLAFGCASSTDVNPLEPEIVVEQLPASEFVVERGGAVSIGYRMVVRNRSAEPITLRMVEMQTSGRSPYVFEDPEPQSFNETIEPGNEVVVSFDMWARFHGGREKNSVFVRGIAHFEGASGSFQTVFSDSFRQPEPVD